ncbi:hypothetical protein N2152v2_010987 [Parachlorella kessleri]
MAPPPGVTFVVAARRRAKVRLQPCSTTGNWLQPQRKHKGWGPEGEYCLQAGCLQFLLHHEYDSDLDEEPEVEPVGFVGPTAPPLEKALIVVHDRLRHLPVTTRHLIAGGVSAAASKSATAPLETIKMQLVTGRMGIITAAQRILQQHGPLGFFRGNLVDVARTVPSKAIELASYEAFKKGLRKWKQRDGQHVLPDAIVGLLAGGMAGVLSTLATYPLETVRTRLAVTGPGSCAGVNNVLECVAKLTAEEGPRSLYRGLDVSLAGVIPYAALRLGCYDALKWSYKKATGKHHIDAQAALVFGAVAGVASSSITYPLEVARRRMMMGAIYPGGVAGAITTIARQEGVAALFSGVWLGLVKQAPTFAIQFAAFEQAKQWLDL